MPDAVSLLLILYFKQVTAATFKFWVGVC